MCYSLWMDPIHLTQTGDIFSVSASALPGDKVSCQPAICITFIISSYLPSPPLVLPSAIPDLRSRIKREIFIFQQFPGAAGRSGGPSPVSVVMMQHVRGEIWWRYCQCVSVVSPQCLITSPPPPPSPPSPPLPPWWSAKFIITIKYSLEPHQSTSIRDNKHF